MLPGALVAALLGARSTRTLNFVGRNCILSIQLNMVTWDETKRKLNIKNHGLDFADCDAIWEHFTVTREDKREDYGEARLVCFGILDDEVVVMVYTERRKGPHVISLRKAEKYEARYYRQVAKENLG